MTPKNKWKIMKMLSTFMVVLFVLVELNNMILIKLNGKDYGKYT